jgi:hypothetical protein
VTVQLPQFAAPVHYACTNCDQIATGDFNGDGKMDVVVSSVSKKILTVFTNAWITVTDAPSVLNGRRMITRAPGAAGEFFRLKK